jgi:hypothetical protein
VELYLHTALCLIEHREDNFNFTFYENVLLGSPGKRRRGSVFTKIMACVMTEDLR